MTLLVFSGLDNAGKTTQIELLSKALLLENKKIRRVWSRIGYTPFLDKVREIIRWCHSDILPPPGNSELREQRFASSKLRKIWLILSMLDYMFYLGFYVRYLMFKEDVIIADRWIEDSELDLKINFPQEQAERWLLWRFIKLLTPKPAFHFMLWVPVDVSQKRSIAKKEPFPEDMMQLERRLNYYKSNFSKKNLYSLNGTLASFQLHHMIIDKVRSLND